MLCLYIQYIYGIVEKQNNKFQFIKILVSLLRVNGIMTQGELAEAIYGDKLHTPNIYSALMSLVGSNRISDQEHTPHDIPSVIYRN